MPRIKPTDWTTEDNLLRLEGWARDGLTDKQIAKHKIGISEGTFCKWKKEVPEILEALKKGKEPVDYKVENALLKRALGYEYEETITEIVQSPDGGERKVIRRTKKVALPDTTAQIFWLKNRLPKRWRDRPEATDETALNKLDEILQRMQDDAVQRETV